MSMSTREFWGLIHGIVLGGTFLLSFAGGLIWLYSLRPEWLTAQGLRSVTRWLRSGTWVMAIVAWLTVLAGTYIVYPWYRAKPPAGADLRLYPRSFLLAHPEIAEWHKFGMEWKEHVAWFSPILATVVAYIVWRYGEQLAEDNRLRNAAITLFILAFVSAAVAGVLGALITKNAPVI
ncbi:MAG: hypothetical protein J7M34_07785 [Anaerolineae bacterium]|nr:hypothetical protein [Anaerolineae bacterium]